MLIPVRSSWLPGYIDVTQTVLVVLTMAGLFPDRPRVSHLLRKLNYGEASIVLKDLYLSQNLMTFLLPSDKQINKI